MARVPAGGADRDVSEIRGEIRDFRQATADSLNALREDQLDMRRQMTAGFARVDEQFTKVDDNFAKVDGAAAGHQHVVELLNTLIAREHGE